MDQYKISVDDLKQLVSDLLKQNWNVVCQTEDGKKFSSLKDEKEFFINPSSKPSDISMKEVFFPKSETLFYYGMNDGDYKIDDPVIPNKQTVIIGAKPCDAAATPILSKVFNWDYKDEFFNKRVEQTIIIGTACNYNDENCFCTSVGLTPSSENGSDIFIKPIDQNNYVLKIVTEKGKSFADKNPSLTKNKFEGKAPDTKETIPTQKFEYTTIKKWLDENFSSGFWNKTGELCIGCAQCAYVCPTCHCFDIVDESCGYTCGQRVKNWDSCQFGLFTKHASGHNPRDDQGARYRQRISHKFKYYHDHFDEILCTGCGRCTRGCPVSINISEVLENIAALTEVKLQN